VFDRNSSDSHGFSAASHEVPGFEQDGSLGHRHADVEIHCWDQPVQFLLAGRKLDLPAHRLVLFWAGNPHQLIRPSDQELRQISWITLPFAWLRRWKVSGEMMGELLSGRALQPMQGEGWEKRLEEWVELIRSGGEGQEIASLELQALFMRMQREHRVLESSTQPSELPLAVEKALLWMLEHFKEAETARDIPVALGYNPKYMMTVFSQHVGQTLHSYLNQLRIMEAQRLLLQSEESVTHIALECGFQSLGRFYAAFRKTCGQTPRQFRASLRSQSSGD